ncbi:MAG TPA: TonB family protein [Opitutaceae bacterium]|nr:TonB family protein [Opitutaceae bacterium]
MSRLHSRRSLVPLGAFCFASAALFAAPAKPAGPATPATPPAKLAVTGPATILEWSPAVAPGGARSDQNAVVTVRIIVDETGAISAARVLDGSGAQGKAALEAIRKWKFSPATDEGKPVATCLDVPFVFSPLPPKPSLLPPSFLMPKPAPRSVAVKKSTPLGEYPESLLGRGIPGRIVFQCKIGADGRPLAAPVIHAASHVDFVLPAVASSPQWEFQPAMQGDLPIVADVRGEVAYEDRPTTVAAALAANGITAPDGSAPVHQPQPRVVVEPVWPHDLLLLGEGGSAEVTFTVEPNGRVNNIAVKSATHPAFGSALAAAMEMWIFEGALENGRGVTAALRKRAEFKAIPADASDDSDPMARLVRLERAKSIRGGAGLDQALQPLYRVAPLFPAALAGDGKRAGQSTIEFVIDRDGRVRLPRIVSASNPALGWSAATAIGQWVFRAPVRGGQPTEVKVALPITF